MNWKQLLTSPPPNTGWLLDSDTAAVLHRDGKGELHCASEAMPEGGFEVGPVGLQGVDSMAVGPVLARLKGAAEGAETAAVVVPTGWFRSFVIEADRLPRKQKELEDVVRWRLKKLLPIPPTDLRLAVVRLPESDGRRQILCLAGIERALGALETCIRGVGVEPGLITTRLFALASLHTNADRPTLLIQHEAAFLSLLLLEDKMPKLLRTKPLAAGDATASTVLREVGLTLAFIREGLGIDPEVEVHLTIEDPGVESELRRWLAEQPGLVPGEEPAAPPCAPATVVGRLGAARLAPAVAVVTGGLR